MSIAGQFQFDGFGAIAGGVDSGRSSFLLDRSQLSWLINGTARGGFLSPRPGLVHHPLNFLDEDFAVDTDTRDRFATEGRFQRASSYIYDDGRGCIVTSIGGRLFRIDIDAYNVQDLTAQAGFTNDPSAPRSWFCQAEHLLLHQNASDVMCYYDGSTLRQANPVTLGGDMLPGGSVMTYNNGRVWLASPDGKQFVAGDAVYSDGTREAVLKLTENQFLTGGGAFTNKGAFAAPAGIGPITGMHSLAVQDTATGQSPLQVFGPFGAFGIRSDIDRTAWQTTTNPVQSVSLLSGGLTSQEAGVNVNGDLWIRSPDGIRSYALAQRDHGTWVNTPLSREVERVLGRDDTTLLGYASGCLFDNRLLQTTAPYQSTNDTTIRGIAHRGLVALDFAPVSSMFARGQPVWEGLWTGLQILQVLTVNQPTRTRCFIFALNDDSEIELWELTRDARFDTTVTDQRIAWVIETPSYGFERGGWALLQIAWGDIWLNRVAGVVDAVIKYRPDSDPIWRPWSTLQACATYANCDHTACTVPSNWLEQYRTRLRLPEPDAVCDTSNAKPTNYGYRFAARIELTGHCQVPQFRIAAREQIEDATGACPETTCELVGTADNCNTDDFGYAVTSD